MEHTELQECVRKIVNHCRRATVEDCFACELLNQRTQDCFVGYCKDGQKSKIPKHWKLAINSIEDII